MNMIDNGEISAVVGLVEAQVEAERVRRSIPGISAAIVDDQRILWSKGFGYSNLEQKITATPQTIYRVGSITKTFTATMMMQLRDAGRLQLDDPIQTYLPEFKIPPGRTNPRPVTFRQVIAHVSGLPREAPLNHWVSLNFPSIEDMLASLPHSAAVFSPYVEYKYSNLGISVLGHALERIASEPYAEYVRRRILQPLGMANSELELNAMVQAGVATGYTTLPDGSQRVAPHPDLRGMIPAGGLYSSVEDIARYISLQFRDVPAGGDQVLDGRTLREMHTPVFMNPDWQSGVGISWRLTRVGDRVVVSHGGGVHGFTTHIAFMPALKLGVAIFTNTGTDPESIATSTLKVLAPVFDQVRSAEERRDAVSPSAGWQDCVGHYSMAGVVEMDVYVLDDQLVGRTPRAGYSLMPEVRFQPEREENTFRMRGGPVSGELAIFELGDAGKVTGLQLGPYPLEKL